MTSNRGAGLPGPATLDALQVYLGEIRAGVLTADADGRMTFAYDREGKPPRLSLSLPVRSEPHGDAACRPFFAGLLPEGAALERAAAVRRLQVYETFRLLQAFGGEGAGAVRLLAGDESPQIPSRYEPLEGVRLAEEIEAIGTAPVFAADRRTRLSLAGVQSKTAVLLRGGILQKPLDGSPSTHIIKVGGSDYPGLVENERFCMSLARRLGLAVAGVEPREADGYKFLLVERYDRRLDGDRVVERHQEDFCQALGYPPARKYELDDKGDKIGPGLEECFGLLEQLKQPGLAKDALLRALLFNYLIANADAHAKNYSLIYDDVDPSRAPSLAPLYDLVCTRLYSRLTADLAMRHGSAVAPGEVNREAWDAVARQAGVRIRHLIDSAEKLGQRILNEARALQTEGHPYLPAENIIRVIGERLRLLSDALDLDIPVDTPPYLDKPPGWSTPS